MSITITHSMGGDASADRDGQSSSYLILAMRCAAPLAPARRFRIDELDVVELGRGATADVQAGLADGRRRLRIELPDGWMSGQHCRLVRVGGLWSVEDSGSKNGTQVNGEARGRAVLTDRDVITAGGTVLVFRRSTAAGLPDRDLERERAPLGLGTVSPELERELATLARIARAPLSIVLGGPTGSGKEVVARAIHVGSGRPGPFVAVNCGALAPSLIESELFGVKRGAFSGATEDRPGLIRASDGGTLFLDEIGELPATAQAALLRVLQESEVLPVGGHKPVPVALRVIGASHKDLAEQVAAGNFRQDLYARLRGHEVALPSLAARREDLGQLVAELLPRLAGERAPRLRLRPAAAVALFTHDWPLNVRELVQVLGGALAIAPDDELGLEVLPAALARPRSAAALLAAAAPPGTLPPPVAPPRGAPATDPDDALDREDPEALRVVFAANGGNVSAIARALGTSRSQVRRLAKRAGIALDDLRGDD